MPNDLSWDVDAARVAANVNLVSAFIDLATPGITATASSSSAISIALTTPSPNATSYDIERSTDGGVSWSVLINNRIASDFPYTDAGLTAEATYHYRVIAKDATSASGYSVVTSDTTNPAVVVTGLTDPARLFTVTKSFEGTVGENTKNNANGMDDWGANTVFSNEQVFSGTTSGKMHVYTTDSDGGTFNWGGIISFLNSLYEGDEFWVRFRMFLPVGFIPYTSGGGGHIKFTRIKTYQAGGANGGLIDYYWHFEGAAYTYKYIKEFFPNQWNYFADSGTHPHIFGQWVTFNQYYKLHSDPAQAIVRFWRDNDLLLNANEQNLSNSTDYATDFYLFTYWNGAVPQNQFAYVDDVVITSDINSTSEDPASGLRWVGV